MFKFQSTFLEGSLSLLARGWSIAWVEEHSTFQPTSFIFFAPEKTKASILSANPTIGLELDTGSSTVSWDRQIRLSVGYVCDGIFSSVFVGQS